MNVHEAERVIVISEPHGHPELIGNALGHADFNSAVDGLICAGELVDGNWARTCQEFARCCGCDYGGRCESA